MPDAEQSPSNLAVQQFETSRKKQIAESAALNQLSSTKTKTFPMRKDKKQQTCENTEKSQLDKVFECHSCSGYALTLNVSIRSIFFGKTHIKANTQLL